MRGRRQMGDDRATTILGTICRDDRSGHFGRAGRGARVLDAAASAGAGGPFRRGNHARAGQGGRFSPRPQPGRPQDHRPGRQDLLQSFFRKLHADEDELRPGRAAVGCRYARFHLVQQQPFQGRDLYRHGQEHRGDGRRRGRRAAPHARQPPFAFPKPEMLGDQRRRRRSRAPDAGAFGHHDHPPAARPKYAG